MDRVAMMRRKQNEAAGKITPAAQPPKQPKKAKEPPVQLTHKCGHVKSVKEYENIDCSMCRDKARRERCARQQAQRDSAPKRDKRLPAGAEKRLVWDGTVWHGALLIPETPPFYIEASSERACFHGLHNEYVKWLAKQGGAPRQEEKPCGQMPTSNEVELDPLHPSWAPPI